MGILNVTPDSFSDGGMYFDRKGAVERGLLIAREGADIIDVGGESTRPGARPVAVEEELRRVIPVIEELCARTDTPVSVDTSRARVAREAIEAGASLINDVMGTPVEREMAEVAARYEVPIVVMHMKGQPLTMQDDPSYDDLMGEIAAALSESIATLERCGVAPGRIIIDPGIGFGKTAAHNIEIMRNLHVLRALCKPVLVGPSRKSFIGAILGIANPAERVMGTAAAVTAAIAGGADIVRVHDVAAMSQVCRMADALYKR